MRWVCTYFGGSDVEVGGVRNAFQVWGLNSWVDVAVIGYSDSTG